MLAKPSGVVYLCQSHPHNLPWQGCCQKRFFSLKKCLIENRECEYLIVQRIVYDGVSAADGVASIHIRQWKWYTGQTYSGGKTPRKSETRWMHLKLNNTGKGWPPTSTSCNKRSKGSSVKHRMRLLIWTRKVTP